ncbi:MAG: ribosomal RNA small subunit methyltransferase A, partial [Simkaniaceae bacterium]|nr:ribosomal RNA small subunit methyltransferase A [Simkaniaceae bacterium]
MVSAAGVKPGEHVLEIGPGTGVLTVALLRRGARVTAVETDPRCLEKLRTLPYPRLTPVEGDILRTELRAVTEPGTKVVANIPYHITGILLRTLLPRGNRISSVTLMVQSEIAGRLVAV